MPILSPLLPSSAPTNQPGPAACFATSKVSIIKKDFTNPVQSATKLLLLETLLIST